MSLVIHNGNIECSPSEVNYDERKIHLIDQHLNGLIKDGILNAAGYILIKNNKIFAHSTMGKLNYKSDEHTFEPNSIRRIASISKVFTAIGIMQLIEKGIIYLKQPVHTVIGEFKPNRFKDISIYHLLTHTSGLFPTPGCFKEPYPIDNSFLLKSDWIKEGLRNDIRSKVGEEWAYSSFGYMILAEIIQRVSGLSYEDYIKFNIFEPLKMEETYYKVPTDKRARVSIPDRHSERLFEQDSNIKVNEGAPKGHSGIYSTLLDMSNFAKMLLNKGQYGDNIILSRKSIEQLTRNHLNEVPSFCWNDNGKYLNFGLGVNIEDEHGDSLVTPGTYYHEGSGLSGIFVDKKENFSLVYFNLVPVPVWRPEPVTNFLNLVWSGLK